MTTKTKPTGLTALTREYLDARARRFDAKAELRSLENALGRMEWQNEEHAADIADKASWSSRLPLITAARAFQLGSGSGYEVVYRRCPTDGHDCDHRPEDPPYDAAALAEAAERVTAAKAKEAKAAKLQESLVDTAVVDVAELAQGARYAWWSMNKYDDPAKTTRYRGAPVTDEQIIELGPLDLRRQLNDGSIVEVQI